MSAFIFGLSLRQLLFRRSTAVIALACLLPILVAVIFRLNGESFNPERWTARALFQGMVVTVVLPLAALLIGTAALGDELEDGTAVYLLTKPIQRWQILAPKLLAAWLVTLLLVLPPAVIASAIALQDQGGAQFLLAIALALAAGAFAYCAIFVLLSIATTRALITGLVYVFVWEGVITTLFTGTRYLSIRHYTLSIADWLSGAPPRIFNTYVGSDTAVILAVAVTVTALAYANRLLQRLEVRETSS
jgi:ABC-2 type transport system permease protein